MLSFLVTGVWLHGMCRVIDGGGFRAGVVVAALSRLLLFRDVFNRTVLVQVGRLQRIYQYRALI